MRHTCVIPCGLEHDIALACKLRGRLRSVDQAITSFCPCAWGVKYVSGALLCADCSLFTKQHDVSLCGNSWQPGCTLKPLPLSHCRRVAADGAVLVLCPFFAFSGGFRR